MKKNVALFGILLVLLSACGAKAFSSPTTDVFALQTAAVTPVPTSSEVPATLTPVAPLNLSDPESIVYWLAYDIAYGQTDAFRQVITGDTLQYGTGSAGGRDSIDKSTFLAELGQRITYKPTCAGYDINDDKNFIMLWTNNWQPSWVFRGEQKSEEMTFSIFLYEGQIEISAYFTPASTILDLPTVRHKPCPAYGQ